MTDLTQRIAALSPEKRDLLLRRVRQTQPAARPAVETPTAPVTQALAGEVPFPLTPIQKLYWVGHSGLYDLSGCGTNAYFELHFPGVGAGFVRRLDQALQRLIERHPMLRAVALPDGSQRILPEVPPYRTPVRDLRGLDENAAEAEITVVRERLRYEPGDTMRWPLFDVLVHLLDGGRLQLHLRFEPFIFDGSSRNILFDELFRLLADPGAELPPLSYSYPQYALETAAQADGPLRRRAWEYWSRRLPSFPPPPELPTARDVSPALRPRPRNRFARALGAEEWNRFKTLLARERLTPSSGVFAVFAEVLAVWSRNARYTLPLEGTYRPPLHPGIGEIVGNFNTLLLLAVDSLEGGFAERARRLQEQARDGLDHQQVTGQEVLQELHRLRGSSRLATPVLFNSLIEYNRGNDPAARASQIALNARYADAGLYTSQLLVLFTVDQFFDGSLNCRTQAVEEAFPEGVLQALIDAFCSRLQSLASGGESWTWSWPETARRLVPLEQLEWRMGPRHVLNEMLAPCPDWVVGDLYVEEGGRLRRTGDAARVLPSGEIEVLGREGESLVRVLGYPVDLGPVERLLETVPGVRRAAMVPVSLEGRDRLAAWVEVPEERGTELLAFLEESLAYYMVPDLVICVPALPLDGDVVDRSRLAAMGRERLEKARMEAAGPVPSGLRLLWEELLGRQPIGDNDNFFDLGGTSFLLARLMNRVAERFGAGPPLVKFFREPTLAGLTRLLRTRAARLDLENLDNWKLKGGSL